MANLLIKHIRDKLLFLGIILLLFIAACNQQPQPPTQTAECNPVAVRPPQLPDFVESVTYQGPVVHGPVHSLHVEGDMVYMGLGDSFAILDVSNAAEPQLLGTLPLYESSNLQSISAFSLQNGLAYLEWYGSYTVDLTNPAQPVEVTCAAAVPWFNSNNIFAGRYYINNSLLDGIHIMDWRAEDGFTQEVGTYAIYTPPTLGWRQPAGQRFPSPYYIRPNPIRVMGYSFDDRYLYMLDIDPINSCCFRLTILDLENPSNPHQVSTTTLSAGYIPDEMIVADGFLFILTSEPYGVPTEVYIYDVRNRREPLELNVIQNSSLPIVHNGFAYFSGQTGLDIWKLATENGPALVGNISIPGLVDEIGHLDKNQLAFLDDYIYLAAGSTLAILNNQDPANPHLIHHEQYPLLPQVDRLVASEGRIVANSGFGTNQQIQILELDDQGQMGKWNSLPGSSDVYYWDIAVLGNYLYALGLGNGESINGRSLLAFDLDETAAAGPGSRLYFPDFFGWSMAADFPYLYIPNVGGNSVVTMLDISEPSRPRHTVEMVLEATEITDLVVLDDNLFTISSYDNGLLQFDISDRNQPELTANHPFGYLIKVAGGDGFLFGLHTDGQIAVVDIRSSGPVLVGDYNFVRGIVTDIAYENGTLYLAMGSRGVAAVRLNLDNIQ